MSVKMASVIKTHEIWSKYRDAHPHPSGNKHLVDDALLPVLLPLLPPRADHQPVQASATITRMLIVVESNSQLLQFISDSRFLSWALHIFAFDLAYEPEGWPWKQVHKNCSNWDLQKYFKIGTQFVISETSYANKCKNFCAPRRGMTAFIIFVCIMLRSNQWWWVSTSCW